MARLLCQSALSGAFHSGTPCSSSPQPDTLLRESSAPTAHPHVVTRHYALRACLGRIGASRRARDSWRLVSRAGSATIYRRLDQTALSRPCQASRPDRVAMFFGGYQNRFTIVVDDDIDPTRIDDVVWALSTRCDPESGIDIQRRCWSSSLDPMIHPDSKVWLNSRAVIEACRPYEWREKFPEVAETSPELRNKVLARYGRAFFGLH